MYIHPLDNSQLKAVDNVLRSLEKLILVLPTSEIRNRATELNILAMNLESYCKDGTPLIKLRTEE